MARFEPFVFVTKYRGKPTLRVTYTDDTTKNYPLTRAGCLQAGSDIYKSGAESWMNSSSVDHPQETKPRCRLDIREIMGEAFNAALAEQMRPQKELVEMILKHCEREEFQKTLTPKQQALFKVICEKTRKGE